ncbi:hypothetical protein RLIN73S_07494 [Rhodanobacter lindaniclasticus]
MPQISSMNSQAKPSTRSTRSSPTRARPRNRLAQHAAGENRRGQPQRKRQAEQRGAGHQPGGAVVAALAHQPRHRGRREGQAEDDTGQGVVGHRSLRSMEGSSVSPRPVMEAPAGHAHRHATSRQTSGAPHGGQSWRLSARTHHWPGSVTAGPSGLPARFYRSQRASGNGHARHCGDSCHVHRAPRMMAAMRFAAAPIDRRRQAR